MQKHLFIADDKTGKSLIVSGGNFNHMMYHLESMLASQNDTAKDCMKNQATGLYEITTENGRTFYYDENREYLLTD